jgi:branched-chain amino acid transport system permease protein
MFLLSLLISSILLAGAYALFSVGLSLQLGVLKVFNLAHGAVLTATTLTLIRIAEHTQWSLYQLVPLALFIGAGFGLILEFLAIRPIRRKNASADDREHAAMISTLAVLLAANVLTVHFTHGQAWLFPFGTFENKAYIFGGLGIQLIYIVNFVVAVSIIFALAAIVRFTQTGRALRAIAEDQKAAELLGINVGAYAMGTTIVASALAGLAGLLLGVALNSVSFDFGDTFLYFAFVIIVLGGMGSILGTLVAAIILAMTQSLVGYYAGGSWNTAVALVVLILVLVVRPHGLFGRAEVQRA